MTMPSRCLKPLRHQPRLVAFDLARSVGLELTYRIHWYGAGTCRQVLQDCLIGLVRARARHCAAWSEPLASSTVLAHWWVVTNASIALPCVPLQK
jgi:hypothetical protein